MGFRIRSITGRIILTDKTLPVQFSRAYQKIKLSARCGTGLLLFGGDKVRRGIFFFQLFWDVDAFFNLLFFAGVR